MANLCSSLFAISLVVAESQVWVQMDCVVKKVKNCLRVFCRTKKIKLFFTIALLELLGQG
jgi:hypothetical protein